MLPEVDGVELMGEIFEIALVPVLFLSAYGVLTYKELLERVWGGKTPADRRPLRSTVKSIRRKLGDDARNRNSPRAGRPTSMHFLPPGRSCN